MKPLSKPGLRLHLTCGGGERILPPAIREAAPSNTEVRDAPEEAEVAGLGAVFAITVSKEPARESEASGAAEASEGLNPDAPQKAAESTGGAQAPYAEEPALLVEPL